ncbi:MAG TPA: glycosyltransferase family 2 protein [Bryobacteraceae bacterium]|nr:glycosyltransferase family 2 protein [Bryobacteraceae bacterium]
MEFRESLSVVVPVYNSERSLSLLIERLEPVLRTHAPQFEVILVNDGSRDQSWEVIHQLTERHPWVRGICLMRNYGQHNALLCGIRAARHQVIVTLDDDLQNPPEEIPKLLAKLAEGYDVVYGAPEQEQHGLWRDVASRVTKIALQSAVGVETARHVSAFRAFRTEVRGGFANFQGPFVSIDVLLTWGASRFTAIPVRHDARRLGTSQYTLRKLIRHALTMMTGFSVVPLQVASVVGFIFTAFGFLVLAFVLGTYLLRGRGVPGFPFLASLVAMFSGVQMFALGIIGEYLARMHFRMMDRPGYAIRQQTAGAIERAAPRLVAGIHA